MKKTKKKKPTNKQIEGTQNLKQNIKKFSTRAEYKNINKYL